MTLAVLFAACTRPAPRWEPTGPAKTKHAFMREVVTPEMEALFRRWDRHRYPRLGCASCHGHEGFVMPNDDLRLEPEALHGDSPMLRFMRDEVTPTMSRLLGRKADCWTCHARDE